MAGSTTASHIKQVLTIGTTVVDMLDPIRTPLTVVRIEPALIVRRPHGGLADILAHLAIPQSEA